MPYYKMLIKYRIVVNNYGKQSDRYQTISKILIIERQQNNLSTWHYRGIKRSAILVFKNTIIFYFKTYCNWNPCWWTKEKGDDEIMGPSVTSVPSSTLPLPKLPVHPKRPKFWRNMNQEKNERWKKGSSKTENELNDDIVIRQVG